MSVKYIPCMQGSERTVMEYDTINGFDDRGHGLVFIFNRNVIVSSAYDTLASALREGWGEWSERPVRMPDGSVVKPIEYFHMEEALCRALLQPWHPGVVETICGEERLK